MKFTALAALACSFVAAPLLAAGEASGSPSCDGAGCVPYVDSDVAQGGSCHFGTRYVFGLDSSGGTLVCTAVNQWAPSPPLIGVRAVGAPCDRDGAAAQSPDGLPLGCMGASWGIDFNRLFYPPAG
jgi:hypothetical protein